MKKNIILSLMGLIVLGVTVHASIIWNFDTLSPATITKNGYFYVYTGYVNNKGIGGSNALQIAAPYETGVAPHRKGGGGIWMSNFSGFSLNTLAPYLGPINNTSGNLNLSANTIAYFSIIASNTTPFGVCFTVYDTSGHFFVPNGNIYVTDSEQLQGSISTTVFKQSKWNIANRHVYAYGQTSGRAPALANIEAFWLFFPVVPKGTPSGQNGLNFYIDNVGATSGIATPTTGVDYSDWSIFSQSVIPTSESKSAIIKE